MFAIYKRELKAYFLTPIGYVFCGMFLLVSGLFFSYTTLLEQSLDSLPNYFLLLIFLYAIMIPLLTMKLFSEDRKSRTEQILLTSPVSLVGMVMGKYLAALTVFVGALFVNSGNFILLYTYGMPNTAAIFVNIFGAFLIGCVFIAIGIFLSSLTENQLIAAISSIGVIGGVLLVTYIAPKFGITWIRVALKWFSILDRYAPFTNEILDLTSTLYFVSLSAVFVFLTIRVYEKRRWS